MRCAARCWNQRSCSRDRNNGAPALAGIMDRGTLVRVNNDKIFTMNAKEMTELYDYNLWANNRLFEAAAQLPTEQYLQDCKSSHGGIHGTLTHIVGAQKIWVSRWRGTPENSVLQGKELASLLDLIAIWEK